MAARLRQFLRLRIDRRDLRAQQRAKVDRRPSNKVLIWARVSPARLSASNWCSRASSAGPNRRRPDAVRSGATSPRAS